MQSYWRAGSIPIDTASGGNKEIKPVRISKKGRRYFYFPRMMKVGITDRRRNRCLSKIVEGVDNWNKVELNPYKLANTNREGFIGRDLMLKLLFRITLDPALRRSTWELL
jgi:hypothetical protein